MIIWYFLADLNHKELHNRKTLLLFHIQRYFLVPTIPLDLR